MSESTLSYCQIADRRYEADTSAESECPYCRALAAEARAAQLEAELKNAGEAYAAKVYTVTELQRIVSEVTAERDEALRQLEQAVAAERDRQKSLSVDFMNELPTLWGDHVRDGKITITIDAELVYRIENL